jgi:hypothetical protein
MNKVAVDLSSGDITHDGKKVGEIYEPQQFAFNVPSKDVSVIVGHEEVVVVDNNSGKILLQAHTR